jgi:hypothetical protein
MVPGSITLLEANNPQTGFGLLLLNFASTAQALPAPHMGTLVVEPANGILYPSGGGANSAWSVGIPNMPNFLGMSVFAQSFHLDGGQPRFFASNGLRFRYGFYASDIEITGIDLPGNVIGNVGPRDYRVHYRNNGPAPANFNVHVTVGSNWGNAPANVGGFDSGSILVSVPTPPAFGSPHSSVGFQVVASTAFTDCNPGNNQRATTVAIAVPFWDLHVSLVNVPTPVWIGGGITINWAVDVRNHGNVWSGNYDLLNQINCTAGQGNYGCTPNLPVPHNGSAPLAPGQVRRHFVNYFVPGHTWRQTQWVKAEITFGDVISAGNYDEAPIAFQ